MPDPVRVLIVDDKVELADTLADGLIDHAFDARALGSSRDALAEVRAGRVDLLITDLRMPELDGLALLDAARTAVPDLPVIVMTAYGAVDSAIESVRKGAYHYLTKPFKLEELLVFVERALADRALRRETAALRRELRATLHDLIGASPAMQRVFAVIQRIAPTDVSILITGETGTGKTAVARALHHESGRAAGPFVAVNCAALPEPLLESELFGHVKGAFTGATADRGGLFAEAHGGTLLLDEIGEMSPALQAKLLHVLESGQIRPVGSTRERPIDTRVLAATHRDLHQRIADGTFREDLLYRLDLVTLDLPALRDRRDDLPALLAHFVAQARRRHPASPVTGFARDALARLLDYAWPGNIRELAHVVERCVLLGDAAVIAEAELPPRIRIAVDDRGPPGNRAAESQRGSIDDRAPPGGSAAEWQRGSIDDRGPPGGSAAEWQRGSIDAAQPVFRGDVLAIRDLQRAYARWAFDQLGGHKARTAERLGIDVKTLTRWLAPDDR